MGRYNPKTKLKKSKPKRIMAARSAAIILFGFGIAYKSKALLYSMG